MVSYKGLVMGGFERWWIPRPSSRQKEEKQMKGQKPPHRGVNVLHMALAFRGRGGGGGAVSQAPWPGKLKQRPSLSSINKKRGKKKAGAPYTPAARIFLPLRVLVLSAVVGTSAAAATPPFSRSERGRWRFRDTRGWAVVTWQISVLRFMRGRALGWSRKRGRLRWQAREGGSDMADPPSRVSCEGGVLGGLRKRGRAV